MKLNYLRALLSVVVLLLLFWTKHGFVKTYGGLDV
jgi:hypothetical protein